ncbi:hypothetical protein WUBG_14847, partial [Wuchereria bancrofti]
MLKPTNLRQILTSRNEVVVDNWPESNVYFDAVGLIVTARRSTVSNHLNNSPIPSSSVTLNSLPTYI